MLLRNVPEIITTMFATWSLGAGLTPINPALTDDEVVFQLDDSGCALLVGDSRAEAVARGRGIGFLPVTDECFHGTSVPTVTWSTALASLPTASMTSGMTT